MKKERNADLCKYCMECLKPCPYGFYNDDICTMTIEQCKKKVFVRDHLKPMLRAANLDIIDAVYEAGNSNGEWITITYRNGHTIKRDVSCDSIIALVRDAIKGL
ncbi:MAG: hypothetical protein IJB43_09030 [Clostridia bacterium]|nr:hypothetical protein [Clostridia bacterium]